MSDSHQIISILRRSVDSWASDVWILCFVSTVTTTRKLVGRPSHAHSDSKEMTRFTCETQKQDILHFFQSYLVEMMLHTYFVSTLLFFVTLGKHLLSPRARFAHSIILLTGMCYFMDGTLIYKENIS